MPSFLFILNISINKFTNIVDIKNIIIKTYYLTLLCLTFVF